MRDKEDNTGLWLQETEVFNLLPKATAVETCTRSHHYDNKAQELTSAPSKLKKEVKTYQLKSKN